MRDVPGRETAAGGRAQRHRPVDLELERGVGGHRAASREARDDHALQLIAETRALLHVLDDVLDVLGRVKRGPAAVGVRAGGHGFAHRQQHLVDTEVRDLVAEAIRPAIGVLLTRQGAVAALLVGSAVQIVEVEPVVDDHEVTVPIGRKGHAEEAAGLACSFLLGAGVAVDDVIGGAVGKCIGHGGARRERQHGGKRLELWGKFHGGPPLGRRSIVVHAYAWNQGFEPSARR